MEDSIQPTLVRLVGGLVCPLDNLSSLRALGKPETKSTIVPVDSTTNDESIEFGADRGS